MESARLRGNLYSLDNGYYISKNDPLYWKKLLIQRPEDKEALYHVGLDFEIEANKYLDMYKNTNKDIYLGLYRKSMKRAFDLVNRSLNKGFVPAREDVLRLERALKREKNSSNIKNPKDRHLWLISIVLALILGIILGILFIPGKILNTTNNTYPTSMYLLPYEVIEKKPTTLNASNSMNDQVKIIVVKSGLSKELLIDELISRLKADYETNPASRAKQVVAIDETNTERGMASWVGGNKTIQVYIYPPESKGFVDSQERQLWETSTVLRSATYQFYQKNGYLPKDLKTLIQPFPNNYLTEIPNDPYELRNSVTLSSTGEGGWIYSCVDNPSNAEGVSVVKAAVKPNIPSPKEIPFSPISISINKETHTLLVISGDKVMRHYSVALGKENLTPEGNLFVSKKVMNPDKIVPIHENAYGTRAMELANMNFAIHGTNAPSSIGQDLTQGCIRLKNSDMEDLYSIIPLYTPVRIEKNFVASQSMLPLDESTGYLYSRTDNSIEEDNAHMYHWAH